MNGRESEKYGETHVLSISLTGITILEQRIQGLIRVLLFASNQLIYNCAEK